MEYDLLISDQAGDDIFNAVSYYGNINPLLADRFSTELFDTFQKIKSDPQFL